MLLLMACLTLDPLVHSGKHCSTTGPDEPSCTDADNDWDAACLACEDEYAWDLDYPWTDATLGGLTVRPIDAATVTNHRLETTDGLGTLDAWVVPGWGDNADTTVLYNHGNYIGLEHYMPRVRMLHEAGYTVLVWDYRGYGKSEPSGAPTGSQWIEDSRQIRDWADTVAPDRIALYANSVGGVPAIEMAVYDPGCALVLEAAFTSIELISASNNAVALPGSFLTEGEFENHEKIKSYEGPLLSMIGTEDNKFPVEHEQLLFDNAGTPDELKTLWILEGVGHGISTGGVPEAGLPAYFDHLAEYLGPGTACQP